MVNEYLLYAFYNMVVRHQEKKALELINRFERIVLKQKIINKNEFKITKDTLSDKSNVIIRISLMKKSLGTILKAT